MPDIVMDRSSIEDMYRSGHLDQALRALLDAKTEVAGRAQEAAWVMYMMGRIAWKEGRRADAMACYAEAVTLDPASEAAVALEQARAIMAFYNKDMYNP